MFIEKITKKKNVDFDEEEYPFNIDSIKNFNEIRFSKPVTFIVGENGMGKSTLLEAFAIYMGFNPEGGTINFNFSTMDSHSCLADYITISRSPVKHKDGFFLRAESFYNVATEIQKLDDEPGGFSIINSYGGISLHEQSHGESFFSLMVNRFGGNGLYILDEPEAALSPTRQMAMLSRMYELVQQNSQFIIATHSPILMGYPDAEIYEITDDGLHLVEYENTEHYRITKYFLNNTSQILDQLLGNK